MPRGISHSKALEQLKSRISLWGKVPPVHTLKDHYPHVYDLNELYLIYFGACNNQVPFVSLLNRIVAVDYFEQPKDLRVYQFSKHIRSVRDLQEQRPERCDHLAHLHVANYISSLEFPRRFSKELSPLKLPVLVKRLFEVLVRSQRMTALAFGQELSIAQLKQILFTVVGPESERKKILEDPTFQVNDDELAKFLVQEWSARCAVYTSEDFRVSAQTGFADAPMRWFLNDCVLAARNYWITQCINNAQHDALAEKLKNKIQDALAEKTAAAKKAG